VNFSLLVVNITLTPSLGPKWESTPELCVQLHAVLQAEAGIISFM
jgi:hypothetical protein